jgi:caa(3)-type oxidase subunit IV
MAAHVSAPDTAHANDHHHPTTGTYAKIGVVLFVLTALEVALYELTYGESAGAMAQHLMPFFVPALLLLSAGKFALVAMYYMHLKNDGKLLSSIFIFPIIIAAVVIVSLVILMAYHNAFARGR